MLKQARVYKHKFLIIFSFSLLIFISGCGAWAPTKPSTLIASCSLDVVAGGTKTDQWKFSVPLAPPTLEFRGWFANYLSGESPEKITVVLADDVGRILAFKNGVKTSRPDVAKFYKRQGMEQSGFEVVMDNFKKPGVYTLTIQGVFGNDNVVCSSLYTLTAN